MSEHRGLIKSGFSTLSGTFLICNEEGTYSLADHNLEIEYGEERDDEK